MKALLFAVCVCLGAALAQTPPPAAPGPANPPAAAPSMPDLPDETVVAIFDDGSKFTMGDFKNILTALPQATRQMALIDRKNFVQWWAGMRRLAQMAEQDKMDQASPAKDQLAYNRIMILGQAKLNFALNSTSITPDDVAKSYEADKDSYKQVRVKAIYIAFGDSPAGKQSRSEAQAKQKADKLLEQIRGGADFVKLVKENSDDVTSREKDGDFATVHRTDGIPPAISAAVFALKKGETSEPVRQPNGYYLLRAEDVTYAPLDQVRSQIYANVQQRQYRQWLQQVTDNVKVQFPSAEFLGTPAAPPAK